MKNRLWFRRLAWALVAAGCLAGLAYVAFRSALARVVVTIERVGVRADVPKGEGGILGVIARVASTELVVETTFDVENRNIVGTRIEDLAYHVLVNGHDVGAGHATLGNNGTFIEAQSHNGLTTETRLSPVLLASAGIDAARQGGPEVEIDGEAQCNILGIPFTREFAIRNPSGLNGQTLDQILQSGNGPRTGTP